MLSKIKKFSINIRHLILIIILLILIWLLIYSFYKNNEEFNNYTDISNDINNDIITFIIPTIGRDTLQKSINSIINQTNKNWKAIIIFDGIKPTIHLNDERIKIISVPKLGQSVNSAGLVRNEGIKLVNTKWIGFLDDDDFISNDYVETFYQTIKENKDLDLLIFRMINCNKVILPLLKTDNFYTHQVGISFIMKKKIFDNGYIFTPSSTEDFMLLDKIRKGNYKMMISPYVKYYVRCNNENKNLEKGNEVKINF
jgi:glycosyltransferase involved in cell wall biosynthesis